MKLPLVVGVDGSEASLRALDWTADEAALHGVPLRVVYACLWERYEGTALAPDLAGPSGHAAAEDIVGVAMSRARHRRADLSVTTAVVPEEPEYVLARESRNASLVVVGTCGRGGLADALLGSVSLTVATHAHCPVVVVRGDHHDRPRGGHADHIVVGVSDAPTRAVRVACEEARRRKAVLEAVRTWRRPSHETVGHPLLTGSSELPYEERAAEELDAALADAPPDVTLHRRTAEGHARHVLLAASQKAGLLVIGRRRPGQYGPRLGRVAHTVLHHSGCPVMVVPDGA